MSTPTESLLDKLQLAYKRMTYPDDRLTFYTDVSRLMGHDRNKENNRLYIVRSRIRTLPVLTDEEVAVFRFHHLDLGLNRKDVDRMLRQLACDLMLQTLPV